MTDIYDIKTFLFWFIYSFDYLFIVWTVFFLVFFYFLLNHFFGIDYKLSVKTKSISNDEIKKRFDYLVRNVENFDREIFYREVSLFLKILINKKFGDNRVFFMTLDEIQKTFKNPYNDILKEVYFLEFNDKLEDNLKLRKEILKKIEIF